MSGQTLEKLLAHARHLREQGTKAQSDHNHLTQVRNRLMSGTATRDEVFLALNTAATQMLIISQTSTKFADLVTSSCQIEQKRNTHSRATGIGKNSAIPAPKLSPKTKATTEEVQPSLWTARDRNNAFDRMETQIEEMNQHLDTIFQALAGELATREQKKKPGPTLRLIIGGKGSPEPPPKRKSRKREEVKA